ncbi:MAG: rhomboid family intramembrane serine protease [Fimbriimonadia bacterium]|jgi:membrane associated rhomboid family serine protease
MRALPNRIPYLSAALAGLLVLFFLLGRTADTLDLAERYGFSLSSPALLTSLTYLFVHGGAWHLLLNLLLLGVFATYTEIYGRRTVWLALAVVGAVVAAYGELLMAVVTGAPRTGVMVGASGAISAMAGWSFILGARDREPDLVTRLVRAAAVGWLALQIVAILLVTWQGAPSATAHWAHLWGFVVGGAVGAITGPSSGGVLRRASALIRGQRPADALALLSEPMQGPAEQERLLLTVEAWNALGDKEQAAASLAALVQTCPTPENIQNLVEAVGAGGVRVLQPDQRVHLASLPGVPLQARIALLASFVEEARNVQGRASAMLQLADLLKVSEPDHARALLQQLTEEYSGTETADLAASRLRAFST